MSKGTDFLANVYPMPMKREASEFSKRVADVLVGRYKGARLSQADLAGKTRIKPGTLRRLLAGESEIETRDLILIAVASGTTAESVLREAVERYGGMDRLVSEVEGTTDDLDTKRKEKARAMTVEQIETEDAAATRDPELDTDEP